jgi:hypothetical protein
MDQVSVADIASSCFILRCKIASSIKLLEGIRLHVQGADDDIGLLTTYLDTNNVALAQLKDWLDQRKSIPKTARDQFGVALWAFDVIVSGLDEHVEKILLKSDETASTSSADVQSLWSKQFVEEQKQLLSRNLLAFQMVTTFIQQYGK